MQDSRGRYIGKAAHRPAKRREHRPARVDGNTPLSDGNEFQLLPTRAPLEAELNRCAFLREPRGGQRKRLIYASAVSLEERQASNYTILVCDRRVEEARGAGVRLQLGQISGEAPRFEPRHG